MRPIYILLITLLAQCTITTASCQVAADTNAISNEQFKQAALQKNTIILDVRTVEEFTSGHIEGATNIDVLNAADFKSRISGLPKDKNYLLYCKSGKRSAKALSMMQEAGFTHLKHLQHGITGWDGPVVQ